MPEVNCSTENNESVFSSRVRVEMKLERKKNSEEEKSLFQLIINNYVNLFKTLCCVYRELFLSSRLEQRREAGDAR